MDSPAPSSPSPWSCPILFPPRNIPFLLKFFCNFHKNKINPTVNVNLNPLFLFNNVFNKSKFQLFLFFFFSFQEYPTGNKNKEKLTVSLELWEISLLEKLSISMMKLSGFVLYWSLFDWSEITAFSSNPLFTSPEVITWAKESRTRFDFQVVKSKEH